MNNFYADIVEGLRGEPCEAIVITDQDPYVFKGNSRAIDPALIGKRLTLEQAHPLLEYKYDDGYGHQDCHSIFAWTPTRVIYVHEYDGSTSLRSVPRNPPRVIRRRRASDGGPI